MVFFECFCYDMSGRRGVFLDGNKDVTLQKPATLKYVSYRQCESAFLRHSRVQALYQLNSFLILWQT